MQRLGSSNQITIKVSLCLVFMVASLLVQVAYSQEIQNDDLIPRSTLFSPLEISEVRMSWDGKNVAFIKNKQLLIQSCPSDTIPRVVPNSQNLKEWHWTYSNSIIYLKENKLYHFQDKQLDSLTFENCTFLSLKGLSAKLPNQLIIELHFLDENLNGLYQTFLDKNQEPQKIIDLQGFDDWYFDENLKPKVATKPNYTGDHSLWYLDHLSNWKLIADYPWQSANYYYDINHVVSLSADGKQLYFIDNQNTDKAALKQMNLTTQETQILYEDSLADLLWDATLIDNLTRKPLVLQSFFSEAQYHFLEDSLQADFDFLQKEQKGDVRIWNTSLDGRYWLVSFLNGYPPYYYRYDSNHQKLESLMSSHPQLSQYPLAKRHALTLSSTDSLLLASWYFLPIDKDKNQDGIPDEALPTVFYIHGGPWLGFSQNSWYLNRNLQLLANRGYAVVYVEFRGALGYGKKFTEASYQTWGTKMSQDVMATVNACVEKEIAQEGKLAILGWSYGGYAVLREVTYHPETFACGMAMFAVGDLVTFLENQRFNPNFWKERVGDWQTENGKQLLKDASPFYQLEKIQAPLLITHGGKDQSIPSKYSEQIVEKLQSLKKEVSYIFYPDEPHNYRKDDTWISFWAITEQFLKQQVGGTAESPQQDLQKGNYQILVGKENIAGLED